MEKLSSLTWETWQSTRDTLHLYCQILGKIKLAYAPPRNHWWNVVLILSARGLTTGALRHEGLTFELRLDFVEHAFVFEASDGAVEKVGLLDELSVSAFDAALHQVLAKHGLDVEIDERPFGTPVSDIPFPEDSRHATYKGELVERFWRINDWVADVLEEFAGWFCGKQSPVHLFWHSFDLALTRFSGRRVPAIPGADPVTQEAYSHEVISFGFWSGDMKVQEAAFYSYTAPEPQGLTDQPLMPEEASWTEAPNGHLAFLPYEAVREANDSRRSLLAFLESAYQAGARAAGWDAGELQSSFCPSPLQLKELVLPQ